ncbi:beta-1,3-galactosyl-O-glycosyl-glycoprotein beta-1,6-N-acetylglucosaminyltransferase [Lingula anatina]|uniref:Beta-1,3-galactosyl-O-glycosyl-glycoprotein beta-1,6-N-acetylglucosaminyltransferase n=1 Tax=Lingula anatina TaxID=7574 RepID=A0A1S3HM68_LINAN|nr:beta-1,3-galactosyl-O-glycosyl-glycoprotein beta-1,6-N-acetylglucosaminyltransferase [Lingula anatina]|eukprot:XP_013386129.1 beta-1,3-galactosyl-O-glycosyl-glycoprotein beta-1,6-N-acetylglucosaminyltransferase [Lingula anatina]
MEQRTPVCKVTGFAISCGFCLLFLFILLLYSGKENYSPFKQAPYAMKANRLGVLEQNKLDQLQRNCKALFEGDRHAVMQAKKAMETPKKALTPDFYKTALSDCTAFKNKRKYILSASPEEKKFPLAFSILVYKDIEQVERLLRAVYRPHNFYCIHVDSKSPKDFYEAVVLLSECLENVFMAPRRVDVRWAEFSVLEPEILCMRELLKKKNWKYFLNLVGQEFPLKTNKELVKILQTYNNSNDIDGNIKSRNLDRTEYVWSGFYRTNVKKSPPRWKIKLAKGSVHIAATRGYVDYVINSEIGKYFLEWVKDTGTPDETFFATLNINPHLKVPGAFTGDIEKKPFLTRYKLWLYGEDAKYCGGKVVRAICVFGVTDLPKLLSRKELFANKFHLTFEPLAYDCMEELYFNRTANEDHFPIDVDYYSSLPFVKQHI